MIKANLREQSMPLWGHYSKPFDVYVFKNLLERDDFDALRHDAEQVERLPKNNDLYKFHQSKDLISQTKEPRKSFRDFSKLMLDQVRPHLEKLTGLELSDQTFDITCSKYCHGDYLLCHNDDVKDTSRKHARALAFIYYMNEGKFEPKDGGALQLYRCDEQGEPVGSGESIRPTSNSLTIFETSPTSWHSVEEVWERHDRLSINGWFHHAKVPSSDGPAGVLELCPYTFFKPVCLNERLEKFFKESINSEYMMEKTCYLEKYQEIAEALKEAASRESIPRQVGPYNKRNYHTLHVMDLPQVCRDLFDAFKSELFFMLLSRLTGLDLQPPSLARDDEKMPGDSSDEDPDEEEDEEEDDDGHDDDGADEEPEGEVNDEEKEETGEAGEVSGAATTSKRAHYDDRPGIPNDSEANSSTAKASKRKRVSDPLARLEFRHLKSGSYTLVHDHAYETCEKSALDVMLHFNHDFEVNFDAGGYIAYIDGSNDEQADAQDGELLTVEPKSNCLSLVYRDEGTCRFLKYLSKSHQSSYQDLSCVYYEKPDDLPKHAGDDDLPVK